MSGDQTHVNPARLFNCGLVSFQQFKNSNWCFSFSVRNIYLAVISLSGEKKMEKKKTLFLFFALHFQGQTDEVYQLGTSRLIWPLPGGTLCDDQTPLVLESKLQSLLTFCYPY